MWSLVAQDDPDASPGRRAYLLAVRQEMAAAAAVQQFEQVPATRALVPAALAELAKAEAITDAAYAQQNAPPQAGPKGFCCQCGGSAVVVGFAKQRGGFGPLCGPCSER